MSRAPWPEIGGGGGSAAERPAFEGAFWYFLGFGAQGLGLLGLLSVFCFFWFGGSAFGGFRGLGRFRGFRILRGSARFGLAL